MSDYRDLPGLEVEWFLAIPAPYEPSPPPRPGLEWAYPVCTGCGHSMRDLMGDVCREPFVGDLGPQTCNHYCGGDRAVKAYRQGRA